METNVGWVKLKWHKLLGRGSLGVHMGMMGVAAGRQASWMEGSLI